VAYIVGELVAPINVDTKPFEQGLDDTKKKGESWAKDVGKSFSKAGDGLDKVGKGLTTHVTLPIVGAGTAVIMTAANFEASMNRVRGLTGATGSDLEKLTARPGSWAPPPSIPQVTLQTPWASWPWPALR